MPATKAQLDAARAQELEADLGDDYVTVPLAGYDGVTKDVRTLPVGRWRASALRALNRSDFDGFFEAVLHEDDFEIYEDLDPTAEGVLHFAEAVAQAGGDDLGKSSPRRPSSRSTRKR
ncbi:hypothetical protein C9F11_38475 [Streptomyces sp. YIM 121038]|uniref:hypothetical protein n=1 Tax=Streptomyces sp. YIM 121038 TaxID=2136401 RepID=UPI00111004F7|nr:hypothetical protein [Streptomyces sp. YIM 121038]QCX81278.1 hypothetical protein C9F11_38475 [Streptomyces sp. YIM 121038]